MIKWLVIECVKAFKEYYGTAKDWHFWAIAVPIFCIAMYFTMWRQ